MHSFLLQQREVHVKMPEKAPIVHTVKVMAGLLFPLTARLEWTQVQLTTCNGPKGRVSARLPPRALTAIATVALRILPGAWNTSAGAATSMARRGVARACCEVMVRAPGCKFDMER